MPYTTDWTVSQLAAPTTAVNADDVLIPDADLLTILNDFKNGVKGHDILKFYKNSVTIASDAISLSNQPRYLVLDTESAASTDNLATISGGSDGQIIFLYATNAGRVITVKNGTGNIKLSTNCDIPLSVDRPLQLFFNGTYWADEGPVPGVVINTQRTVVGSAVGSVSISNIPATFKHLLLVTEIRTDVAATFDNLLVRFNDDTTVTNYYMQYGFHSNTTWTSAEVLGATHGAVLCGSIAAGASAPANVFGIGIIYIPNYAASSVQRALTYQGGSRGGTGTGTMRAANGAGFWLNAAAAINKITLLPQAGTNIAANSAYTLYGLN